MTGIVNLHQARTRLSQLVERAARGEQIVIAKAGKPKAKLAPLQTARRHREPKKLLGITYIAEDFDDPMPDIEDAFAGKE
jgi:prevent-host-death family protein